MILCVYSDPQDPIVRILRENKEQNLLDVTLLSVGELLNDTTIFDSIEDGVPAIHWTLASGDIVTNSDYVLLVNRVLQLDEGLFRGFHEDDREYAFNEFWAYLSFALSAFPRCSAVPNHMGLAGASAPLPMQWQELKQVLPHYQTPEFYLGVWEHYDHGLLPDKMIVSDPYQFFSWRPNRAEKVASIKPEDTVFAFERPEGAPVSVFICGSASFVKTYTADQPVDEQHLLQSVAELQQIFDLKMGEYLFFVNEGTYSFASAHTHLSRAIQGDSRFRQTVERGVSSL